MGAMASRYVREVHLFRSHEYGYGHDDGGERGTRYLSRSREQGAEEI